MDNVYSEILRFAVSEDKNGYGVTAMDVAKHLNVDSETARGRLKGMADRNLLELVTGGKRHMWKLPGHDVKLREGVNHYVKHKDEFKLTVEALAEFMKGIKPGTRVEYAEHFTDDEGYKLARVRVARVLEVYPHIALLDNRHTCLAIELWWYIKQNRVIGMTMGEVARRAYGKTDLLRNAGTKKGARSAETYS